MPQDNVIIQKKTEEQANETQQQPGNVTLETLSRRVKDLEDRVTALE